MMTPLRQKAWGIIQDRIAAGEPIMVAAVARKLEVDRRSARRIIRDLREMAGAN